RFVEHVKDDLGCAGKLANLGEDLLLPRRKDVRFAAEEILQVMAVDLQPRLLVHVPPERLLRNRQHLRHEIRQSASHLGIEGQRSLRHSLVAGIGALLIPAHHRILQHPLQQVVDFILHLERLKERQRRLPDTPLVAAGLVHGLSKLLKLLLAGLIGRINVIQTPLSFLRNLLTRRKPLGRTVLRHEISSVMLTVTPRDRLAPSCYQFSTRVQPSLFAAKTHWPSPAAAPASASQRLATSSSVRPTSSRAAQRQPAVPASTSASQSQPA